MLKFLAKKKEPFLAALVSKVSTSEYKIENHSYRSPIQVQARGQLEFINAFSSNFMNELGYRHRLITQLSNYPGRCQVLKAGPQ